MDVSEMICNPMCLPPRRAGSQPRTSCVLPFRQLNQWPTPAFYRKLLEGCLKIPHVRVRQSRMASPETYALWIPDAIAAGPSEAFIDQHEFCHVNPLPEGGLHLTLPHPTLERVVALGWGALHPAMASGLLKTLILVYAPRNVLELEVVLNLVSQSCYFAKTLSPNSRRPIDARLA